MNIKLPVSQFLIDAENKRHHLVSSLILVIISLGCLVPFLNKAFHMDDPLYLWAARQIQHHPFDFYGFTLNWYGQEMPMFSVMKNPPFASYYIAVVSSLFGWAEWTLHAAFLIPAIAAVIGTYYLAKEFCSTPLLATLASVFTPVFLLSSTTVMCDVMMLSLWVWATLVWIHGLKSNSPLGLIGAAILIGLCSLTKYFGMSLIPLLFVYSLAKKRNVGLWTFILFIPVLMLVLYQWWTLSLYGRGLLLGASYYVRAHQQAGSMHLLSQSLIGLFFTGGCFFSVFFFALVSWRRKTLVIGAALITLLFILFCLFKLATNQLHISFNWLFIIQCCLFAVAGIGVLFFAAADLLRRKDADSLFLFLWIVGTFIFASFLNWTVNGRSVLPMFPIIGILVLRYIEQGKQGSMRPDGMKAQYIVLPLIPSLLVALAVARADYTWANIARSEAVAVYHNYRDNPGKVWFEGHWGFQYYMEKNGGKALDRNKSIVQPGDVVIIPSDNSNVFSLPEDKFKLVEVSKITPSRWLSTMNYSTGAGFYSSAYGPLPFVLGPVPDVEYAVFSATDKQ